jgi:tetratricopeptide (TPR) repeat protein
MTLMRLLIPIICLFLLASCKQTNEELIQEGVRLANKKNYKEAIDIYTKIITNNNKIELAYFYRGQCYYQMDEHELALKDFNKILLGKPTSGVIIPVNPDSPVATEEDRTKVTYNDALFQRAIVSFFMDSVQSSYRDFQTLIDANYKKVFCIIWQADIWHTTGNDEKACRFLQRARRLATSEEEINEVEEMTKEFCAVK